MTPNRPPFQLSAPVDADDIKANEPVRSRSDAPSMGHLLQARISRRSTLRGGFGLAAVTILAGAGLAGCSDDDDGNRDATDDAPGDDTTAQLNFASVAGSKADRVVVPEGYVAEALIPWGTPIVAGAAAFDPATNTAADQAGQTGMHHDGMYLFALGDTPDQALLAINHENISRDFLFPNGRQVDENGLPNNPEQIRREMAAHGVAVVKIVRDGQGRWSPEITSMNRRITAMTNIAMSGPAAGSEFLVTPYSASGMATRGTVNNCARGYTPWKTYLTCEENIQGYFITRDEDRDPALVRYGINEFGFGFFWSAVSDDATDEVAGEFARFDVSQTGRGPTEDWRNEVNNFGWVVEIDPYDPSSTPKKRTAMGRFRHEGVEPGVITEGKPIAFYMGDDARGEYCYKFVTADNWNAASPMPDMLDRGTLYVARFNDDGSGEWLALDVNENDTLAAEFSSQAELLVKTRIAADIVNATPMDRPEWSAVDPKTGEIYYTLTNNSDRGTPGEEDVNAANPRATNTYGHIIRQAETGDDPAATTFTWDIFAFGAPASGDDNVNISGLTEANEFGSPDGLWFDRRGVLWIQTDNGGNAVAEATNNQMLAVIPVSLPNERLIRPDTQASLKRFLVGPTGCEITGIELSADAKTLFANVQHPTGGFPDYSPDLPPRSATVAIRRSDGGEIAL